MFRNIIPEVDDIYPVNLVAVSAIRILYVSDTVTYGTISMRIFFQGKFARIGLCNSENLT
jgi:hypothetical protein